MVKNVTIDIDSYIQLNLTVHLKSNVLTFYKVIRLLKFFLLHSNIKT